MDTDKEVGDNNKNERFILMKLKWRRVQDEGN